MRYAGPVEMSAWRMPSISGTSHTVAVMTGESDSGETLSPKNAPVQTAPAAAGSGTPRPCATPMQATPTVPHDVPAMVDISVQRMQTTGRNKPGVSTFMP